MTLAVVAEPAARTPPHSTAAERACLGAVLLEGPGALRELQVLAVDDFLLPAHREILEGMRALRDRGVAVDVLTLGDELRARGQLGRLEGGETFLLSLPGDAPLANLSHHVQIVRDLAARRRTIVLAGEIASRAHTQDALGEILDDARGRIDDIASKAGAAIPSAADLVDRLVAAGEPLSTGFRTLDSACRGGFRRGRRVLVGGAPSSGKTTVALGWALAWALAGIYVAVLASDEAAADLLVRLGQMRGLDRDALEASDPATLDRLRAELRAIPTLLLLDGDDGATVETAVTAVRQNAGDRTSAIVVDSVQTARAAGSDDAEGPRARVDAVLAALRRASRGGVVVVATSELSRASYRSRDAHDRIEDMAAGKESGSIEYMAQTLLVLRPVAGVTGEVDVAIPKNRGGDQTPLRLVIDFGHARVHETARPANVEGCEPGAELAADLERVRKVLRGSPGIGGYDRLRAGVSGMGMTRRRRAVKALKDAGEIADRGSRGQPRLYLADGPTGVYAGLPGSTVDGAPTDPTALLPPLGGRASGRGGRAGAEGPAKETERVDPAEGVIR